MPFLGGSVGPSGGSSEPLEVQTPVLSPAETITFSMSMPSSFMVKSVTVDQPCRIRMYDTAEQRTTDASRTPGVVGISGLIFEVVATSSGTYPLDPMPRGTGGYFALTSGAQVDAAATLSIDYAEL